MNYKSELSNQYIYEKQLGAFRPHFQGKPESYYQLTTKEIISALSVCFLIVAAFFFTSVGLFFWSNNVSTQNLVLAWSIILCIFIPFFAIVAYIRSRGKIQVQQQLIKQALQRLGIEKEKRNKMRHGQRHEDKDHNITHKTQQHQHSLVELEHH